MGCLGMKVKYTTIIERELSQEELNQMAGQTHTHLQNILFSHRLCVDRGQANVLLKAVFEKPSDELSSVIANEVKKKLESGEIQF